MVVLERQFNNHQTMVDLRNYFEATTKQQHRKLTGLKIVKNDETQAEAPASPIACRRRIEFSLVLLCMRCKWCWGQRNVDFFVGNVKKKEKQ